MSINNLNLFAVRGSLALVVLCLATGSATADSIAWGSVNDITGDSDVSTNGTLVGAYNFDGPATTINGVDFLNFAVGALFNTAGNFDFFVDTGSIGTRSTSSTSAPFTNLSAEYQALLGTSAERGDRTMTLSMNGLTIGQDYEFQVWVNNSESNSNFSVDVTATNQVTLQPNPTGADGGVGQFVIGAFTADAVTQQVDFFGSEVGVVNGFQLRAIPEPSAFLAVLLPLGVCFRRRR